jgi:hypothetical protein
VDVDRCRATVTLHEPLRRSFSTWLGANEVAEVHSCVLQGRHHGEHLAAAAPDGGQCWFRWDDSGFRLGSDGSHLTSNGAGAAASTTIPTAPLARRGRHASDAGAPDRSSESRSPTEALWALATAIGRLADVIAAASAPTNSNGQAN